MSQNFEERIPYSMTLEQCYESILQCLMLGVGGHYRIGLLYNHIVANRLAVNRGYPTTRAYFRKHVRVLSQSTLTRYGAVSHSFDLAVAEKYGMAALGSLLEYVRLAHVWHFDRKEPGTIPIEMPRRGGLMLTKPFSDCTLEDLRDAIQTRRAWPGHGPLEPEEKPVEGYLQTLKRHVTENARCPPKIDAQVNNRRVHLRIRHLRVWELEKLAEALQPTLKPEAQVAPAVPVPEGLMAQLASVVSPFK